MLLPRARVHVLPVLAREQIRKDNTLYRESSHILSSVRTHARAQNGAGDIAMINGLQKLIDEGVVREGDVALQLQAQGINGGIAGLQG